MKKLFTLLLALVMLLAAFPLSVFAAEEDDIPGLSMGQALEVDPNDSGTFIWDNFDVWNTDLWFKITLTKQGILTFNCTKLTDVDGSIDYVGFYLYKGKNTETAIWEDNSYDYENIASNYKFNIPLAKGTYYLKLDVNMWDRYRELDYTFKFKATNTYETEPNNGPATANALKFEEKTYGYTGTSQDYFSIKVTKNTPTRLYIGNYENLKDEVYFEITYPDGKTSSVSSYNVVQPSTYGYIDLYLKKGVNTICVGTENPAMTYWLKPSKKVSYKAPTITKIVRKKGYYPQIQWKALTGIDGYEIQYRVGGSKGSWKKLVDYGYYMESANCYNYNEKKLYQVRMRTYKLFGSTKYYSDWSKVSSIIPTPTNIKLSATSFTYNGKARIPSIVIKDVNGKTLKKGTDYTVSYSTKSPKKIGKYTITIKFKGNYTGTVKKTFKIVPKTASVNKLTAKTKALTVKLNKQTTQTTGYQIQYATSKTFKSYKTATITSNKTTTKTVSGLKAKTTYYVRVRTYKTVNGEKFYSAWSKAISKKTK